MRESTDVRILQNVLHVVIHITAVLIGFQHGAKTSFPMHKLLHVCVTCIHTDDLTCLLRMFTTKTN